MLLLGCAALAQGDAGDGRERRSTQPPVDPELDGRIERAMSHAFESLESLKSLESLESLSALQGLARLAELEAMTELDPAGGRRDAADADGEGRPIDERRPLHADGKLLVNNMAGSIEVAVWDRNEVQVGGALGAAGERLEIGGDAASMSIVVRMPRRGRSTDDTTLKLRVPAGARLELESVSADVAAAGLRGPLRVNTVSGDIRLAVDSPEVAVQTVSGDLRLRAPARLTRVNSVSGDLRLAGLQGKLAIETVSGNVDLDGGRFSELRLKSISGDLRLELALADDASVQGETLSGEVVMNLPRGQSGTALLKSFSGEAICDGAQPAASNSSRRREFVWGDGRGPRIELSSFSGDIHIRRK